MNAPLNRLSDQHLDQLVDGTLKGDDYRRTLELIETTPDGWRRCALAFLEAQAWRDDLGDVVDWDDLEVAAGPSSTADRNSESAQDSAIDTKPTGPNSALLAQNDPPALGSSSRGTAPRNAALMHRRWGRPGLASLGPGASVAALVLAFIVGWLLPRDSASPSLPLPNQLVQSSGASRSSLAAETTQPHALVASGRVQLVVDRPDQRQESFAVPYFPPDEYQEQPDQDKLNDWLGGMAGQAGIRRYRTVYPEKLNERESVLVPIEYIAIDPGGDFQ